VDPTARFDHLEHRANLTPQLQSHRVIRLVDDEDVGDFENAGLEQLHGIAAAGLQHDHRRVRKLGDLNFGLTDADRLDHHQPLAERFHESDRIAGRTRKTAQVSAARHRANENVGIGEVLGETDAIAQYGAVRKRRAWIDGDDADRFAGGARDGDQCRTERRFPHARRSGEPDRERSPGALEERVHEGRTPARFRARDRTRQAARTTGL
jgi:hypothetical protein